MKVRIRYRSIIKYDEHQETIEYQEVGEYVETESGFTLNFFANGNTIGIEKRDELIYLTNNQATLVVGEMELLNDYQTQYGNIELESRLLMFQHCKPNLKIKYALCANDVKISDVFIVVNIRDGVTGNEIVQVHNK